MLDKLRSLFASSPKTLPQATETLTSARAEIETLAAELTTRDEKIAALTAELATAEKEGETATAQLEQAKAGALSLNSQLSALNSLFAAVGFTPSATTKPEEFKAEFDKFTAKQTTLALAKTGHPPAHVPTAETPAITAATPEALWTEYQAMEAGELKQAFYAKHESAIWAGKKLADHKAK